VEGEKERRIQDEEEEVVGREKVWEEAEAEKLLSW
jgi:hypothetical protein